jgi:hypothetical protein
MTRAKRLSLWVINKSPNDIRFTTLIKEIW